MCVYSMPAACLRDLSVVRLVRNASGALEFAKQRAGSMEECLAIVTRHGIEIGIREGRSGDAFEHDHRVGDISERAFFHHEHRPGGGDVAEDQAPGFGPGATRPHASTDFTEVADEVFLLGVLDDNRDRLTGEGDG